MDISFMERFLPLYLEAAKLTLTIASIGILISLVIGLVASLVLYYRMPLLSQLVTVYVELSRNTPLLVQLFFLYFGLPKIGIRLSPELCGVIGLSFLGGAYMTESFRSGLGTVEKIQTESALSLGLSGGQSMRYIVFPQAAAVSVPSLTANIIFLIKETSVFSGIALADLMYVTKDLIGIYYQTTEALFMLVIAYLALLLPISLLGTLVERRLRNAGCGKEATQCRLWKLNWQARLRFPSCSQAITLRVSSADSQSPFGLVSLRLRSRSRSAFSLGF